jgi:Zn-finger nucleic acid-binding protein
MKCPKCKTDCKWIKYNTFEYWYCPNCKEEVEAYPKHHYDWKSDGHPLQELLDLEQEFQRLLDEGGK